LAALFGLGRAWLGHSTATRRSDDVHGKTESCYSASRRCP
jgi:hypothetical protein